MSSVAWMTAFTVVYVAAMMWLSWWAGRRLSEDEVDFMVGGREFSGLLTAVGNTSILISGGYLPGIVMYGYLFGIGGMWFYIGWGTGALVALLLWVGFWRSSGAFTPTEWFEYRYGKSGRFAISLVILLASLAIIGWQYVGSGAAISGALGVSTTWAILILGAVVTAYVALGGVWAATLTDLVQWSWVILFVFIAIPVYLFVKYGPPNPAQLPAGFLDLPFGTLPVWKFVLPSVLTFLLQHQSLLNQAPYWTRAAGARDVKAATRGWVWTVIITYVAGVVGALIGTYARALLPDVPRPDVAFGRLLGILPVPLAAFAMAGLMAATMSTVDIYLVSGVNQLLRDVAQYVMKIRDTGRLLKWARWATVVYGGLSVLFAIVWPSGLGALFGFGTAIGAPLFVFYLDSWLLKVGNPAGAIASVIASVLTVLIWDRLTGLYRVVHTLWVVFPVSLVVLVVVSLLTREPARRARPAPSQPSQLDELQREVLLHIWRGNTSAADVLDAMASKRRNLQLVDVLHAVDDLAAGGYVQRRGQRLVGQLHFRLTPQGSAAAEALAPAEERERGQRGEVTGEAARLLAAVRQQPGITLRQAARATGIPLQAIGPLARRLQEMGWLKLYGPLVVRAAPVEAGQRVGALTAAPR